MEIRLVVLKELQKDKRPLRQLFWFACLFVATLMLLPADFLPSDSTFSLWDKFQHFVAFAGLCLVGSWAYPDQSYALMLKLLVFGGAIEIMQHATGWRYMEFLDFIANIIGIIIGRWIFHLCRNSKSD